MNHNDKLNAIKHIRPNALFVLRGDEVEWLDEIQVEPTEAEIKKGLTEYEAAQKVEAEARAAQKAALLNKLGITAEEARLLLS